MSRKLTIGEQRGEWLPGDIAQRAYDKVKNKLSPAARGERLGQRLGKIMVANAQSDEPFVDTYDNVTLGVHFMINGSQIAFVEPDVVAHQIQRPSTRSMRVGLVTSAESGVAATLQVVQTIGTKIEFSAAYDPANSDHRSIAKQTIKYCQRVLLASK